MSMSVEQCRIEVIDQCEGPWGKLRLAKASSRCDRRQRYLTVEWCPPEAVGTDLEEHSYQGIGSWWPARDNRETANAAYQTALMTLLTVARHVDIRTTLDFALNYPTSLPR